MTVCTPLNEGAVSVMTVWTPLHEGAVFVMRVCTTMNKGATSVMKECTPVNKEVTSVQTARHCTADQSSAMVNNAKTDVQMLTNGKAAQITNRM
jgi:hypothetical protein